MKVIILAAGYGTRLYPLTRNIPKALVTINGKPMLNYIIEKLILLKGNFSLEGIKLVSNDRFYQQFLDWREEYNIDIEIVSDGTKSIEERLGAIRDIRFAIGDEVNDWLILGADNLFEDNLHELIEKAQESDVCLGVYDIKNKSFAKRYGVVKINLFQEIDDFQEKPKEAESSLIATCIYSFNRKSVGYLDEYIDLHRECDSAGSFFAWLSKRIKVKGVFLKGKWVDIGHFDSLKLVKDWEEINNDFKSITEED